MQRIVRWAAMASLSALILISPARGQKAAPSGNEEFNPAVGDSPDTTPVLARLSPALKPQDIAKAMRKVGDWELNRTRKHFDQDWTFAALYGVAAVGGKVKPFAPDCKIAPAVLGMTASGSVTLMGLFDLIAKTIAPQFPIRRPS